jgi:hypothetical protein
MNIKEIKKIIDNSIIYRGEAEGEYSSFINETLNESYSNVSGNFNEMVGKQALIGVGTIKGQLELSLDSSLIKNPRICLNFEQRLRTRFNAQGEPIKIILRDKTKIQNRMGSAIGHRNLVMRDSYGTYGGSIFSALRMKRFFISNNHVMAELNRAQIGDEILDFSSKNVIGYLENFEHIMRSFPNELDLAVAMSKDGSSRHRINGRYRTPEEGEIVFKKGATTGLTYGTVIANDYTDDVDYGEFSATFVNQIRIEGNDGVPFSAGGDSGAMVFAIRDDAFVGLHFAGNSLFSMSNNSGKVIDKLIEWRVIR